MKLRKLFAISLYVILLLAGGFAFYKYRQEKAPEVNQQMEEMKKKLEDIVDENFYKNLPEPGPGEKG